MVNMSNGAAIGARDSIVVAYAGAEAGLNGPYILHYSFVYYR